MSGPAVPFISSKFVVSFASGHVLVDHKCKRWSAASLSHSCVIECVARNSTVKDTPAKNPVMKGHVVIVRSRSIRVSQVERDFFVCVFVYLFSLWPIVSVGIPNRPGGQPNPFMVQASVYSGAIFRDLCWLLELIFIPLDSSSRTWAARTVCG